MWSRLGAVSRWFVLGVQTGSTTLKLKSASGKEVSSRRADLERLCDHFNIDVENPINVMTQDTSRQFLQKGTDKDRYTFFVKALLLDDIQSSLTYVRERIAESEALIEEKEELLPALEAKVRALDEEMSSYSELAALRTRVDDLKKKIAWALVGELEEQAEQEAATIAEIDNSKLPKLERILKERQQEATDAEKARAEAQQQLLAYNQAAQGDVAVRNQATQAHKEARAAEQKTKQKVYESQRAIEECRKGAAKLKSVLETARQTQAQAVGAQAVQLQVQVNSATAQLEAARDALEAARSTENARQEAFEAARDAYANFGHEASQMDGAEKDARDEVDRLRKSQTDVLHLYGPGVGNLLRALEQPANAGQFKAPPMGPISRLLRLTDSSWALPVEECLGRILDCFIVANTADGLKLQALAERCGVNKGLTTLTYPDLGCASVYPMNQEQLPPQHLVTVLSVLRCPTPAVLNVCIDQSQVERTVLVPELGEGNHVAFSGTYNSRQVGQVYTRDGTLLQVRGGTGMTIPAKRSMASAKLQADDVDLSGKLKAAEQRLADIMRSKQSVAQRKTQLNSAVQQANDALRTAKSQRIAAEGAVRNCERDLDELRRDHANAVAAGAAGGDDGGDDHLAAELADLVDEERRLAHALADVQRDAEAMTQRTSEAKQALDALTGRLKEKASEAEDLQEAFQQAVEKLNKAEQELAKLEGIREKLQDVRAKAVAAEREHRLQAQGEAFKASQLCTREAADAAPLPPTKGGGGDASQPPTRDRLLQLLKQAEQRVTREQGRNKRPYEAVAAELSAAGTEARQLRRLVAAAKAPVERMRAGYSARLKLLKETTKRMGRIVSNNFNVHLQDRGHSGLVKLYHDVRELELSVQMRNHSGGEAKSIRVKDTRSLSGGERSYTTLCFILALNEQSECPFCALDEWDVFMDVVHRKVSLDKMMMFTEQHREKQFILITPLDLGDIKAGPLVRIHRLQPARQNT